jgi:hypothetical protein
MRTYPQVIPQGRTVEVTVEPDPAGTAATLAANTDYTVRFFSKVDRTDDTRWDVRTDDRATVRLPLAFRARGEYTLDFIPKGATDPVFSTRFYVPAPDLAALRPLRGDLHLHTTLSDGKNTPGEMVLRARELGLDFIAITDHDNHAGSVQAAAEAAPLDAAPLILLGEEVTVRGSHGHILSLNAATGVAKWRYSPERDRECAEIVAATRASDLIPPLTLETYADAVGTLRQIRAAGGLAAMAHPYWEGSRGKYYPPRCVFEQLLHEGLIDTVELVGGSPSTEGNLLAVAHYATEAAAGRRWAILGGSDAHATADMAKHFTLVFAPELTARAVVDAIQARRSVACDHRIGADVCAFGPFDLVEYAYFLLREFYSRLDAARASALADGVHPANATDDLWRRFCYTAPSGGN